jgi:hypothetical protein
MSSRIPVFKEPNSVLRDLNSSNTGARSTSLEPEKLWSPIHLPNEHKLLNTFCTQSDEYLSKNRLEVERLHIEKQLIDLHKHLRNKENEIKNIKINADYWEKLQNLFLNNPKPIYLGSSNSPDCVDIRKSLSPEHILYYVQTTLQQEGVSIETILCHNVLLCKCACVLSESSLQCVLYKYKSYCDAGYIL